MFKITGGGYFESKKYTKSGERKVKAYELELSVSGNAKSYFNGKVYQREYGNVFFSKPGDKRKSSGDFECFYIHFICEDKNFSKKYLDNLPVYQNCRDFNYLKNTIQQVVMMAEKIRQNDNFKEEYGKLISAKLSELFIEMYITCNSAQIPESEYRKNIFSAITFIDENFGKYITISDIAKAAMLSESFTYVQFKKQTGQTPHSYLLGRRLEHACLQLAFSDKTVCDISDECGFSNPNYLNNVFKKKFGITPVGYRKKFRNSL